MTGAHARPWLNEYATWTPKTLDIPNNTLVDLYENTVEKYPHRPAVWFFEKEMNYAELDRHVRAASAGLKAFGVKRGDTVAIALPNCPQHIIAIWAILRLGATVVEHNPLYTAHELTPMFQDHKARLAIVWDKQAEKLDEMRKNTPLETIIAVNMTEYMPARQRLLLKLPIPPITSKREELTQEAPNAIPWRTLLSSAMGGYGQELESCDEITTDDNALILYTSGTTGPSKGAQLTHGNMYANTLQCHSLLPDLGQSEEKMLGALPLFHVYGFTLISLLGCLVGGETLLLPAPKIPLVMDVMKKSRPTFAPGVPTIYAKIIEASKEQDVDIRGVRNGLSGAAALPAEVVEEWEELTGGQLAEGYGLTETSPVVTVNPLDGRRRPGYVGIPVPNTEVRIADPNDLDRELPYGEAGELLVKGPQVFKGYLNKPEETEQAFHDGWFCTGDQAVMEEDGFVKIVSRIKEIIITGGFNVYPGEVEDELAQHPDIEQVAVVGRPKKDGSEDVVACIVLRDGAVIDPDQLRAFAKQRLTPYKVPRTFYHFEELAQDQLGKVRRREVQKLLLDMLEKDQHKALA